MTKAICKYKLKDHHLYSYDDSDHYFILDKDVEKKVLSETTHLFNKYKSYLDSSSKNSHCYLVYDELINIVYNKCGVIYDKVYEIILQDKIDSFVCKYYPLYFSIFLDETDFNKLLIGSHTKYYREETMPKVKTKESKADKKEAKNNMPNIMDITTAKADEDKLQVSLVPMQFVRDAAEVRMYGNAKYHSPSNWATVGVDRYINAMLRHLLAFLDDPDSIDEESGIQHWKHFCCNVAFISEMRREDWPEQMMKVIYRDPKLVEKLKEEGKL